MSYFDDASLVMIPSGYKTSKVYSVKPTDGSGDLTFSRSNDTATRVNSAGLIEKVRTNTLTQSGTFSNAAWTKGNLTLTAGQTDPNGGTNAFLATSTGTNAVWFYQANTGAKTFSIYAKAGTKNFFSIINGTYNNGAGFNLSDQTVTNVGAGSLAKIESVGGGWYRCSVYMSTSVEMLVMLADTSGGSMIVGDTMTFAFAQAETGDIATSYIATTSAAVSVGPVANVPRLDYLNSSCPRLLLEPQRQNELQFSEQANNAYWTLFGATISANTTATLDPTGNYGADKLQEDTSTAGHTYGVSISGGSTTKTLSVFAKAAERNWAALRLYNGTTSFFAYFNLSTGAVGSVTAGATSAITSYGNGWYRCSITLALGAGSCEPNIFASTGNNTINYQGVTGSGIYVWGAQLEAGAYATSYIPTLGAAVTRGADACSKTGISSLIGQTEGTMFVEFNTFGFTNFDRFIAFTDGSTNRIGLLRNSTNDRLYFFVEVNGTLVINAAGIAGTNVLGSHKIAAGYKSGDYVVYMDGVQVYTSSVSSVPATSQVFVGTSEDGLLDNTMSGRISQALVFKTRLTNAQLAELTTL